MYEGATVGDQGRGQGEREVAPGAQAFTRAHGWSALGFPRLRHNWSMQTKKSRVLVSSMGSNLMGKGPGVRWGDCQSGGLLGSHIGNFHLLVTLGRSLGHT